MNIILRKIPAWLPALLMMALIFLVSSRRGDQLPEYGDWEYLIKKTAHGIGYGFLALSYLKALPKRNYFLAWLFSLMYAITDEFHQTFVPGRHPSIIDVIVFDNIGAMVALWIYKIRKDKYEKTNQT
jgi:VanZ family protein